MLGTNNDDGINDGFVLGTIGFVSRTNDSRVAVLDLAPAAVMVSLIVARLEPRDKEATSEVLRVEVACLDQQQ